MNMLFNLIHYGAERYLPEKFNPIKDVGFVKPEGGLWTSPVNSAYGWKQWCIENDFGVKRLNKSFCLFFFGKVLTIDNCVDLDAIQWDGQPGCKLYPRFKPLMEAGYDAVHLTVKGEEETRFNYPKSFYGWDCETVFVMNPRSIYFHKEVI